MKRRIFTLTLIAVFVLAMGMTITAYAQTNVDPVIDRDFEMTDSRWTQIAYREGGLDLNLIVRAETAIANESYYLQMRGANNRDVLWSTTLNGNGQTYNFYCGPDVYYVYVKTANGAGFGVAGYNYN